MTKSILSPLFMALLFLSSSNLFGSITPPGGDPGNGSAAANFSGTGEATGSGINWQVIKDIATDEAREEAMLFVDLFETIVQQQGGTISTTEVVETIDHIVHPNGLVTFKMKVTIYVYVTY